MNLVLHNYLISLLSAWYNKRESITNPSDIITVQDAVDGVRRVAFARENSTLSESSSIKKKHTLKSRWQKVISMVGMSKKSISYGIYSDCIGPFDFQRYHLTYRLSFAVWFIILFSFNRILDQWLKFCSLNQVPLVEVQSIVDEIEKRSKQANSKEVKAKLDFSNSSLGNEHVRYTFLNLALTFPYF